MSERGLSHRNIMEGLLLSQKWARHSLENAWLSKILAKSLFQKNSIPFSPSPHTEYTSNRSIIRVLTYHRVVVGMATR